MAENFLLNRVMYKLGYSYRYHKWKKIYHPVLRSEYAGKEIRDDDQANLIIKDAIQSQKPFLLARLGSTELSVVYNALLYEFKNIKWDPIVINQIQNNSGFFPVTNSNLIKFVDRYTESIAGVDIMGVWFNEGEKEVCEKFCPNAEFIQLKAIEPYYHAEPWSAHLQGKSVLVIHPFDVSISNQYHNCRKFLFENEQVLPEFELKTIRAVQSLAGNKPSFESWFDALEEMCDQIHKVDFDVAIIGAGAYGLPLGAYIKSLGKQAIHMGGATQILFGIKGKRWESYPEVSRFFNAYWKRPEPFEVPQNAQIVENACYW